MGTARLGLRSRQKGLARAAFDNWKVQRWSAKMSAGWALGAANDRPSHPVRAVFVISPEMGVNAQVTSQVWGGAGMGSLASF